MKIKANGKEYGVRLCENNNGEIDILESFDPDAPFKEINPENIINKGDKDDIFASEEPMVTITIPEKKDTNMIKKTKDEKRSFEKKLEDYCFLKSSSAVLNERAELDMSMDMYEVEERKTELLEIAEKNDISIFKPADDSDYDELNMYVMHVENILIDKLLKQIMDMVKYGV